MRKKSFNGLYQFVLAAVYVVLCLIWLLKISDLYNGAFSVYDKINIVSLILMGMILAISIFKLSILDSIKDDLVNAANTVKRLPEGNSIDRNISIVETGFYEQWTKETFSEYREEYNRCFKNVTSDLIFDIRKYFNEDALDWHIGADLVTQMASALTGLGMLGTFIGLTIGLSNYSLNSENVAESIMPLMSSIKLAFYTSICGLLLSILLNLGCRKSMNDAHNALGEFCDAFSAITGDVQYDGMNSMISAVSNFSSDISSDIADAVKQELKYMSDCYTLGCEEISSISIKAMEHLVSEFSSKLLDNLNNTVTGLCSAIKETADYQKSVSDGLKKDIEVIDRLSCFGSEINGYLNRLSDLNNVLITNTAELVNQVSQCNEISGQNASYYSKVVENSEHMTLAAENISKQLGEFNMAASTIRNYVTNFGSTVEGSVQNMESVAQDINNVYQSTVNGLSNQISYTVTQACNLAQNQAMELAENSTKAVQAIEQATYLFNSAAEAERQQREISQARFQNIVIERADQIDSSSKLLTQQIASSAEQIAKGIKSFKKGISAQQVKA